jgi:L-aminopeptidase/D-esterase-like protein
LHKRVAPLGNDGITDVTGISVGHYTDLDAATGCTVVLCGAGAVGGVDVRGSAPGTRETDLLRPMNLVSEVHAVLLSGGSAFGLDAASGVMRYLEDEGVGIVFGGSRIPIVPTAILFDLGVITNQVRPGPREGYMACQNASPGPVDEGSVGAGTGATVSGILGMERAVKGGIGTASLDLGQGLVVGAIVAVNAVGSVFDADTGNLVAGPRNEDGATMVNSMALMTSPEFTGSEQPPSSNTTIGVVATNARLSKEQTNKLASVAHDGLAMAVRPAHTMSDGDTMFALATGALDQPANMNRLCAASALCVSRAILRGVQKADGIGGIPSVKEIAEHGNV